jgi:nitroreductase
MTKSNIKEMEVTAVALSPRELLTTSRTVRKRLDLTKPAEREVIEECIAIAQQASTASNMQNWHFVVVTDSEKKAAIAELYRKGQEIYIKHPIHSNIPNPNVKFDDPKRNATQERSNSSGKYLVEPLYFRRILKSVLLLNPMNSLFICIKQLAKFQNYSSL